MCLHRTFQCVVSNVKSPIASKRQQEIYSLLFKRLYETKRLIALTSIVMKTLERLVLQFLKSIIDPLLDRFPFAYRENRSVDDAVSLGLFYVLQHLDSPDRYARILFVDYGFATIIPSKLLEKIHNVSVPQSMCVWILDFLLNRPQVVKIGGNLST